MTANTYAINPRSSGAACRGPGAAGKSLRGCTCWTYKGRFKAEGNASWVRSLGAVMIQTTTEATHFLKLRTDIKIMWDSKRSEAKGDRKDPKRKGIVVVVVVVVAVAMVFVCLFACLLVCMFVCFLGWLVGVVAVGCLLLAACC